MREVDVLVIGAGPGGYVCALRLGQLGKRTLLVEKEYVGGVCLNVGCIPSKAIIHAAKLVRRIGEAKAIGIETGEVRIDFEKLQQWKGGLVAKLTTGIRGLAKARNVEILEGTAKLAGPNRAVVLMPTGSEEVTFRSAVIATGSRPIDIPGFRFNGTTLVSSTEALEWRKVPARLVVIGGGAIGLEMGVAALEFGSQVTVVELLDQLLPGADAEIVRLLTQSLRKMGLTAHTGAKAKEFKDGKVVVETKEGTTVELPADQVLISVGRRPNSEDLGLDAAGVRRDPKGFIPVDDHLRTNVPNIHAIGDVTGNPMLAHKASKEGVIVAEVIAGLPSARDFQVVPGVVFTDPEVAWVGMTEEEAKATQREYVVGKFPFAASGRALTTQETTGMVKIVAEKGSGVILGVHIVGPEASDLISEAAFAMEMGATLEDIALTVHPHPTLPEAFQEAADVALGRPLHIAK